VLPRASAAEHVTRVVPIGNGVPDGEHDTVTGRTPPEDVGAGTWIDTGAPVVDWPSTLAGQARSNGCTDGGLGAVGASSPHPAAAIATSSAARHLAIGRRQRLLIQDVPAKTPIIPIDRGTAKAAGRQRTANSKQPGVTSTRPAAGKCRLLGETSPAAWNCTVRTFSPRASKT
jgi:hypothetical protein